MSVTRAMIWILTGAVGALTVRVYQLRCEVSDLNSAHNFIREAYESHRTDDGRHLGTTFLRKMS